MIDTEFIRSFILVCFIALSPSVHAIDRMASTQPPVEWQRIIEKRTFNSTILADALDYCTNRVRTDSNICKLTITAPLTDASQKHSCEMARFNNLSHQSPNPSNHILEKRLANEGILIENIAIAENIAVDFVLSIANVPYYIEKNAKGSRYINAKTKRPINAQTYFEFAQRVVNLWMQSPGHRENILNPLYSKVGYGVCYGTYQGLESIYVTQDFLGDISIEDIRQ